MSKAKGTAPKPATPKKPETVTLADIRIVTPGGTFSGHTLANLLYAGGVDSLTRQLRGVHDTLERNTSRHDDDTLHFTLAAIYRMTEDLFAAGDPAQDPDSTARAAQCRIEIIRPEAS